MEDPLECEQCCGILAFMGTLGRREHYRCLNCGMDSSALVQEPREVKDALSETGVQQSDS